MVVPLLVELTWRCPRPTSWQAQGGDRHLNFHDCRDNLGEPAPAEYGTRRALGIAGTGSAEVARRSRVEAIGVKWR